MLFLGPLLTNNWVSWVLNSYVILNVFH